VHPLVAASCLTCKGTKRGDFGQGAPLDDGTDNVRGGELSRGSHGRDGDNQGEGVSRGSWGRAPQLPGLQSVIH
jgi:hypothetical protein